MNPLYPGTDTAPKTNKVSSKVADAPQGEVKEYFHLVAAQAIYSKDDQLKQRTVNIMLITASPNILRDDLDKANQGVMARLNKENDVTPDQLRDIVLLNIFPLAYTTQEDFSKAPTVPETVES